MSSRTLAFLLFSAFLLISLEVVAGGKTKDEKKVDVAEETESVDEAKAGGCIRGCCAWGARGCMRCCKAAEVAHEETRQVEEEVNPEGDALLWCRFGCCMKGRYGCVRCCRPKHPPTQEERSEAVEEVAEEVNPEAEAASRCRYGCCMMGRYGCLRCCRPKNPPRAEEGADAAVAAGETKAEKPKN